MNIKRIVLTAIILLPLQANAFEDYLIISDNPVNSVYSSDEKVFTIRPIFTIDNNKNNIILIPKSAGNAQIVVNTKNGQAKIDVKISEDKTNLSVKDGFTYYPLDTPDEIQENVSPPKIRGEE